jgi:hypothetical protein
MSGHDDNVDNEWSDAITEPLEAAPSSGRLAWPRDEPAPPRDRSRSLSRRLLDDLRKPRPVQSRDLVVLVPGLLIGGLLVGLLVAAVAPALFSALFVRFTGIPPHQSATHSATTTHPGATPTKPTTATPVPSVEGAFLTRDTATQGNWSGVYGQAGSIVIGVSTDGQQLPGGVQVTPTNASPYTWADSTDDPRALQQDTNGADRIAACWYAADTFSVAITIPDELQDGGLRPRLGPPPARRRLAATRHHDRQDAQRPDADIVRERRVPRLARAWANHPAGHQSHWPYQRRRQRHLLLPCLRRHPHQFQLSAFMPSRW